MNYYWYINSSATFSDASRFLLEILGYTLTARHGDIKKIENTCLYAGERPEISYLSKTNGSVSNI